MGRGSSEEESPVSNPDYKIKSGNPFSTSVSRSEGPSSPERPPNSPPLPSLKYLLLLVP